jgi:hypothetical protein
MKPSSMLYYILIISIIIFIMTSLNILSYDMTQLPKSTFITIWIPILQYSFVVLTITVIIEMLMIGINQNIIPYIIMYVSFLILYLCTLHKIIKLIVW